MGVSPDLNKVREDAARLPKQEMGNQTGINLNYGQMAQQRAATPMMQAGAGPQVSAATINQSPQDQFRQGQSALATQLMQQAQGQGPSVAGAQLQAGMDQAMQNQMAALASQRGMNAGLAGRLVAQQGADQQAKLAQQAGLMRLQEQNQAQQQLGQALAQGRAQDIGLATTQAEMQQQAGLAGAQMQQARDLANLQAGLEQQRMKDAYALQLQGLGTQRDVAGLQSAAQQQLANQGMAYGSQAANIDFWKQLIGQGMSTGGQIAAMAAMSDETKKKNVKKADSEIKEFLASLSASKYEYKDKKHGEGRYVSPMAQELEKTELGKSMVLETEDGKMVDYGRGFGAILAAQAHLNKRLDKMEKRGQKNG